MVRRSRHTASGANTITTPAHQPIAWATSDPAGVPRTRSRSAEIVTETGWGNANPRGPVGMELTGTKAEDAKTSGASIGNAAAWAVSGSPTARPTKAKTQDIAYENS